MTKDKLYPYFISQDEPEDIDIPEEEGLEEETPKEGDEKPKEGGVPEEESGMPDESGTEASEEESTEI